MKYFIIKIEMRFQKIVWDPFVSIQNKIVSDLIDSF